MKDFSTEIYYRTSRASGPGGQNVNKVETAVTALWKVADSALFTAEEKERISAKLKNRISAEGILQVSASENRTQMRNKSAATARMLDLVSGALFIARVRKPTKPGKAKIEKRLQAKHRHAQKKENRRFRAE